MSYDWESGEYRTLEQILHMDSSSDRYRNRDARAAARLKAESTFRTGFDIPAGELFVAMPPATVNLLLQVTRDDAEIAFLWRELPGIVQWNAYTRHLIVDEIMSSNEIEGVHSTRREVENAVEAAKGSAEGGRKPPFTEAARLYLDLYDVIAAGNPPSLPRTLADIRGIYDKVASDDIGEGDQPDGTLFRKSAVHIEGAHGETVHSGVADEVQIGSDLTRMMDIAVSERMPVLVSSIVAHFIFEYIHPFYDGNGRTGRYLLALYLSRVLTLPTVLSLSKTIAADKNAYYKAFDTAERTDNCGELTFFVNTMLRFIARAQERLLELLRANQEQLKDAQALSFDLQKEKRLSENARILLFFIMQEEIYDSGNSLAMTDAARNLHRSTQSTRKYITILQDAGLAVLARRRPVRVAASDELRRRMGRHAPTAAA